AGRALVKFEGIDSPEQLQAVRNWTIEIPRTESRSLPDDEYFLHDLTGLAAVDSRGLALGTIVDAYEGGGGILLTVETPQGGSFDVPFATAICTGIDLAAKRIVMTLPEGLDDLGAVPAVEDQKRGSKQGPRKSNAPDREKGAPQ
ncbi:MAG: ribosome maturation factor RimM, partial [Thermoanaerobaculia bacterium]